MNWIIVREEELNAEKIVSLRDKRHQHIKSILKKNPGDSLQVVIPNLGNFFFRIIEIHESYSTLEREKSLQTELEPLPIHCFFSLPRPQTAKKILHLAGAYGIQSLSFFATETKNKEYWTSPVYTKEWIDWIETGMSQTGNNRTPKIIFGQNQNWKQYLESWQGEVIVLDRMGDLDSKTMAQSIGSEKQSLFVFGPESGWKPDDLDFFSKRNYLLYTLGRINLRTEFAFSSLLYLLFKN